MYVTVIPTIIDPVALGYLLAVLGLMIVGISVLRVCILVLSTYRVCACMRPTMS